MTTRFNCLSCNPNTVLADPHDLIAHLKKCHAMVEPIKGTRTAKVYLDGYNGYHRQDFEWDFDGVKVYQIWESKPLAQEPTGRTNKIGG